MKAIFISPYKSEILLKLQEKEQSISDLMRILNISYKETHRHIKEMILLDWVNKEISPLNHNPAILKLTEKGRNLASLKRIEMQVMGEDGIKEMDKIVSQT